MLALKLTSPHIRGHDVNVLQAALLKKVYYNGKVNGEYDILTAQAVYRAKYWLGYLTPDHTAGNLLLDYLTDKRQPAITMRALTKRRIAAKKKTVNMAAKALSNAVTHIGQKEMPAGTNKVPWASEWYGVIGPWCAMAVTRWYVDAGSKAFVRGKTYSYVPNVVADAHQGRNNLSITLMPKPGDLVCYDWDRDGTADHIGLFEKWIKAGETFTAIEGNTGIGNDSNGGEVMRRSREKSLVQAFIHVGK